MTLHDIRYTFPQAAYLLLALFFIAALFWRLFQYRKQILNPFTDTKLLVPRSSRNYWIRALLLLLAWSLAVVALMQPAGYGYYSERMRTGIGGKNSRTSISAPHLVILLIDVSASMSVPDSYHGAKRIDIAKEIADNIVRRLNGEYAALYGFTSEVTQISPQTFDYLFVRLMLKQLQINEGGISGTSIVEALRKMHEEYFTPPTPLLKTLILFSDGGDTRLETMQGQERENEINTMVNLLGNPEANHLRVFTIGMGTKKGETIPGIVFEGKPVVSSLQEDVLKKLSEAGRGHYFSSNDYSAAELSASLIARMREGIPSTSKKTEKGAGDGKDDLIHDLFYQFPLGLAIMLLALAVFLPETIRKHGE